MAILKREMGEISRSSEFFSVSELEAQTGQPKENFASVALKELLDNAIDASESASDRPRVSLDIAMNDEILHMVVRDNGPGLRSRDINRIKDFDVRVSDKLNYRSPSRGQQGNALKTILGMPYALGSREPVRIISRGIEHTIYASPDPLGQVRAVHDKREVDSSIGTTVALILPRHPATDKFNPEWWARAYALANPHVLVNFCCFDEDPDAIYLDNSGDPRITEIAESYQSTVQGKQWHKFMGDDKTAPAWYNVDTLTRQIFTHLKNNTDKPLREFVKTFHGLTSNAKAKIVCNDIRLADIHHLSDFEPQPNKISTLLDVMKEVAEPPSPKILGYIGKEHFRLKFDEWYGINPDRFYYKRSECVVDGIPYIIEAACAEVKADRGDLFHLLNFSPTYDDPLSNTSLTTDEVSRRGFDSFMKACYAHPDAEDWEPARRNVSIAMHIVSPAFQFLDRGKTRVSLPEEVANKVADCLWAVCKSFYIEGEKRRKDAYRQARHEEKQEKQRQQRDRPKVSLAKAVDAVMLDSLAKVANFLVSVRDLFYVVRDKIQQYTSRELEYTYFSGLLVKYEQDHGKIPNLYRDPRGFLYEPHTGRRIPLGTREVENYQFPSWTYNKILFVEKKGFVEPLIQAHIPERYDLAIVAAEGYASEAIRTLFQNADQNTDYKLFVMHDADHLGYNIARTMRDATARMPQYHVDVIDLGLKLQEALDMGLQTENYERENAIPSNLVPQLIPLELEYFTGEQISEKVWKARRIELNALGPEDRIAFVERKLAEQGATAKVQPPDDVMDDHIKEAFDKTARDIVREKIEARLGIESMVDQCIESIGSVDLTNDINAVKEKLRTNPAELWSELLDSKAAEQAEKRPWEKLVAEVCGDV
jgi:DNA topoisomerase VI subunit B